MASGHERQTGRRGGTGVLDPARAGCALTGKQRERGTEERSADGVGGQAGRGVEEVAVGRGETGTSQIERSKKVGG